MPGGATLWGCAHLPQHREICMVTSGDGWLRLYKYHYPDRRCAAVACARMTSRGCACAECNQANLYTLGLDDFAGSPTQCCWKAGFA